MKKSNNQTGNNSNGKLTINDLRGDNSGNTNTSNGGSGVAPKQGLTGLLPKTGLTTSSISTIALLILGGVVARFRFRRNK